MSYSLFKNSKVKLLSPIEAVCTRGLHAIKHKLQNGSELGLKRGRWGTGVRPRRPRQHLRAHGCALPVPGPAPAPVLSPEHPTTCHSDSVTPTPGPPSTLPLSRGTSPRPRPSACQQRPLCLPPQADPAGSCTNAPSAPWCKTPHPNAHPRAPGLWARTRPAWRPLPRGLLPPVGQAGSSSEGAPAAPRLPSP